MLAVGTLFFIGRPTAVGGRIRTVVVDTVNAVEGGWFAPHVGKKVGVVVPTRVDGDASAAVARIIFSFWIFTSLAKCSPNYPFWRQRVAVFVVGFAKTVFCTAPARLSLAFSQVAAKGNMLISAVALTAPASLTASDIGKRKDNETAKTLASEIYPMSWHSLFIAWVE
jgi:hypothetical protein